ncbi:Nn.00g003500.m01.CDS01 [Neocucurbitaria sp. VM-36]
MLGDALISFVLVLITDQVGRRKILALGAILMAMSGIVGNEIGPFRAIEESILSQLTEKDDRSDIFAWYTMFGTAGAALGTVTSGWLVQILSRNAGMEEVKIYRIIFVMYAALGLVKLVFMLLLSPSVELEDLKYEYQQVIELEDEELLSHPSSPRGSTEGKRPDFLPPNLQDAQQISKTTKAQGNSTIDRLRALLPQISRASMFILFRLICLFALDSFASGMASPSWLTYFFTTVHHVEPGTLGTLFFTTNLLATLSNFAALPLARRLGPLKTMTFTHLPSAIFLALIPVPSPGYAGTLMAMAFLSLRACTQSMDQAPRQAFLAAVMTAQERTAILGILNIVKTLAQAGGIGSSGVLAAGKLWWIMLGGAGLMKAVYDLLILWVFLGQDVTVRQQQ